MGTHSRFKMNPATPLQTRTVYVGVRHHLQISSMYITLARD